MRLTKIRMWISTGLLVLLFVIFNFGTVVHLEGSEDYARAIRKIDRLIKGEMKKNDIQGLSVDLGDGPGLNKTKGYG
mgnify:CR=1 FL=1